MTRIDEQAANLMLKAAGINTTIVQPRSLEHREQALTDPNVILADPGQAGLWAALWQAGYRP